MSGDDFTLRKFTERGWTRNCTTNETWTCTWNTRTASTTILSSVKLDSRAWFSLHSMSDSFLYWVNNFMSFSLRFPEQVISVWVWGWLRCKVWLGCKDCRKRCNVGRIVFFIFWAFVIWIWTFLASYVSVTNDSCIRYHLS